MIIYQYAENLENNKLYQTCLAQVKSKIPAGVEHIVLTKNPFPDLDKYTNLRVRSDAIRFRLLSQVDVGSIGWIDADTTCNEWPDFDKWDKSKPLISSPNKDIPNADVCFSFGHGNWFKTIYEEHNALECLVSHTYSRILNNHKSEFNFVTTGFFNAINLHATKNKNCISIGSDNFAVVKDLDGEWKFSFLKGVI